MVELPFSRPIPSSVINGRRVTITKAELRSQRKLTHDTFEIKVACSGKGVLVGARQGGTDLDCDVESALIPPNP